VILPGTGQRESPFAYSLIQDGLGSTVAETDSDASVQVTYMYEPFGRTTATGTTANRFQFAGREDDGSTGLYYYRWRYFSPGLHRFLSEDPIGLIGGVNLYRYVRNNPVAFTDPLGLAELTVTTYTGIGGNVFGHIGVGVNVQNPDETMGFHPLPGQAGTLAGDPVDGVIVADRYFPRRRVVEQTITIHTDPQYDKDIEEVVRRWQQETPQWILRRRNCTAFVFEVLKAGGVKNLPNTLFPRNLMRHLQATTPMPSAVQSP